jgi:hypothetical protein
VGEISKVSTVWVFNGPQANFPAAIFSNTEAAEALILKHRLTGRLTRYPIDRGAYDWSIDQGHFTPKKPEHSRLEFIQKFGCASFEHHHYEDGGCA